MSLSFEEKKKLLKALEEDREFRYALMGLLGFREILDRITKLEERYERIDERIARLEERHQELEKRIAELMERQQKLEERFAKLEERMIKLEERMIKLEERQQKLEEEMHESRRVLITIANRFGVLSESGFREAMKYVVQELFGVGVVEKKSIYDEKGLVYGYPSWVDIDVLIRDREHVLLEVKSRVFKSDVSELYRIAQLYREKYGVEPKMAIIGGFIDKDARELAKKLNVLIKPVISEGF